MRQHSMTMMWMAAALMLPTFAADLFRQQSPGQKSEWSDSDTDMYEDTQWDRQRIPADNDQIQMAAYTAYKRFHLEESHTNNFAILYFKTGHTAADSEAGTTLLFDTQGHELLMPSGAAAVSRQLQWIAYVPAGKSLPQGERTVASLKRGDGSSTNAVVKMTDFAFRQATASDYSTTLDFTRGEFNAFNPELPAAGEADSVNVYTLKFGSADMTTTVTLDPGVVFKAPRFEINDGPVTTVLNGAQMHANGSITHRGTVIATNGAQITSGYLGGDGAGTFAHNSGTLLLAGETSLLKTKGSFAIHSGAVTNDSATISISGGSNASTFQNHGTFVQLGGTTTSTGYYTSTADSELRIVGGLFKVSSGYGLYTGSGRVIVEGGTLSTVRFRDSGSDGSSLELRQTGGVIQLSGGTRPGLWMCESGKETFGISLLGGELRTPLIRGQKTGASYAGEATLTGNGARIVATATSPSGTPDNVPFISGLDSVTVGNGGLVLDSNGYNVSVEQDIGDAAGEAGRLVKSGTGTLSYSGECSVSTVVVAGGTFNVVGAESEINSALVLKDGATFSLVGTSSDVSLDSLAATNAVIALDPGDVISVEGEVSVRGVALSWSSEPSEFQDFLVMAGPISAATETALRNMYLSGASGSHMEFEFSYDAGTGKTTARAKVVADSAPSGMALWEGSGAWATPSNWKDATPPTAETVAVFGAEGAGSAVQVAAGDVAGALLFTNGSYVISGDAVLRMGAVGTASIGASSGTHRVSCALSLSSKVPVTLSSDTSLALDGGVSGGGIEKYGLGRLSLGGALSLWQGLTVYNGTVSATGASSLGSTQDDKVTLVGGTLEFDGAGGAAISVPSQVRLSASGSQKSVVFNTKTDATFGDFNSTLGFLVKRGAGTLTIEAGAGQAVTLAKSADVIGQGDISTSAAGINFPADGSEPSGMRGPVSVVEGTLRLVGTGEGASFTSFGTMYVNVPTPGAVASQPRLEVDNAYLSCENLYNGWCLGKTAYKARASSICAVNGATIRWADSMPGYACTTDGCFVDYAATNSTFRYAASGKYLTRGRLDGSGTTPIVRFRLNNSKFYIGTSAVLDGSIYLDLDNGSYYGQDNVADPTTTFTYGGTPARVYGEIFTRNGSILALSGVTEKSGQTRDLTLAFDGGEWIWAAGNASKTLAASANGHVKYEMRGRGVVLRPAEGATLTVNAAFGGEGGIVVDGPGTVAFGTGAYGFLGTAEVRNGTLDLSAAGGLSGKRFAGNGEINGGALTDPSICLALSDEFENTNGAPVFADCAFSGSVVVKTGLAEGDAVVVHRASQPMMVARVAGSTAVDLSHWRLDRSGLRQTRGVFTQVGDAVYLTLKAVGAVFCVR